MKTFDQLCRRPGGSLPNKMAQPQDLKGLYRLMNCSEVTHAAIIEPLRNYTLQNIARHNGYILLIHDATELDYTSHRKLADQLGQIGKGLSRGYICHNVLAVQAKTRAILGLIHPPHSHRGKHGNPPLAMYVVFIREDRPPSGEEPITWLLLTNKRIKTFRAAWQVTDWYESRWIVEEYHKGQKTGVGVEGMQFMAVDRLEPAIALLSAVALTLLDLRDASRRVDAKTRPAATVVHRDYVAVLTAWRYGSSRYDISVHDFYYALARLGGHQNRKSDKPPGWLVLWRGWTKLQSMLDGYLIAQRKRCG